MPMHTFNDTIMPQHTHHNHYHPNQQHQHQARGSQRFRIRGKWEWILVMLVVIGALIVTAIAVLKAKEKREMLAQTSPDQRDVIDPNGASTNFATVETHRQLYELARQRHQQQQQQQQQQLHNRHNRTKNNRYQAENEFHASGTTDMKVKKMKTSTTTSDGEDNNITSTSQPTPTDKDTVGEPSIKPSSRLTTSTKPNQIALNEEAARPKEVATVNKPLDTGAYYPSRATPAFGFDPNLLFLENQKLLQSVEQTASLLFTPTGVNRAAINNKHQKSPPKSYRPAQSSRPLAGEGSENVEHIVPNVNNNNKARPTASGQGQATETAGKRLQGKPKFDNNNRPRIFKLGDIESGNYLTPSELLWLQQNRPDLFRTTGHLPMVNTLHRRQRRDLVVEESNHRNRRRGQQQQQQRDQHFFELDEDEEDDGDLLDDEEEELRRRNPNPFPSEYYAPRSRRKVKGHFDQAEHEEPANDDEDEGDNEPRYQPKMITTKPPTNKWKAKRHNPREATKLHSAPGNKANRNKYSNEESKNVEKYDLLGSGNFEIIRGGIIEEDKAADAKKAKAKKGKKLASPKKLKKGEESRPPADQKTPIAGVTLEGEEFERRNDDEVGPRDTSSTPPSSSTQQNGGGGVGNEFEPFNFDLFANDPLLRGFQGYDNFGNLGTPATGARTRRGDGFGLPLNL